MSACIRRALGQLALGVDDQIGVSAFASVFRHFLRRFGISFGASAFGIGYIEEFLESLWSRFITSFVITINEGPVARQGAYQVISSEPPPEKIAGWATGKDPVVSRHNQPVS